MDQKCVSKQSISSEFGDTWYIHSTENYSLYLQQLQIQASYYAMYPIFLTVF